MVADQSSSRLFLLAGEVLNDEYAPSLIRIASPPAVIW